MDTRRRQRPGRQRPGQQRPGWQVAGAVAVGFVVLLWALELLDVLLAHRLDGWGIRPRDAEGLGGVLAAPLLHGGWDHLGANTGPALVLGFLTLATGLVRGLAATAIIWLASGLAVWLVAGSDSVHLGASGLIFGWITYLAVQGFVDRKPGEIVIGIVVLLIYGGVLWGVLPGQPGVSWQGHLFGALAGVLAAVLLSERRSGGRGGRGVRRGVGGRVGGRR
ncbi:rhomboid family intramembrane serine protease [Nocardioides sp. zg-ZUI104]|uniref:rhomboid family intramembrane serine protease n=1 Tax=Nocardioides faecalis TaxID=2803858 RepID=UPI001BCD02ED|nr:rhomboid family intramembrane serine protease [Nocardioides faecalis]MBS4753336.1 rhomboid family intramembrane serine protease [Nocardioides faecalis]